MVPKFLQGQNKGMTYPVDPDGKPRKYLAFLIPLFKNEKVRKIDMLQSAGIDTTSIEVKGYFTSIFKNLTKLGILNYDPHFRVWKRGENWDAYIGWVITELCMADNINNKRVSRMFKSFTENSTNFILDLDEENSEREQGQDD
jgi:hypothetical protein